jgi:hypothetical protein
MKFYIRGGIGDLLQHFWFIKNYPQAEYIVHSHFKGVKQIFDHAGATNCSFYQFDDMDSHNSQVDAIKEVHAKENQNDIQETPRAFYSSFDFGEEANLAAENLANSFSSKKDIIGIHPFRSGFATSVYNEFNLPAKIIPLQLTKNIISNNYNYLIFGSPKELSNYGLEESENVKFVSFDNILYSLSAVKYCKTLIGLDSCFKSMSSMQKINTICIIGDFPDEIRDLMFVNQYAKDGVMKVFKTKNINDDQEAIEKFILENLHSNLQLNEVQPNS